MAPASFDLSSEIVVRPMTSADVPRIRELHASILPVSYPSTFFLQLLLLPGRICLIAHHRSSPHNPIAFISASIQDPVFVYGSPRINFPSPPSTPGPVDGAVTPPRGSYLAGPDVRHVPGCSPSEPRIEILTLGVLPPYQKHGLARYLVHKVIQTFHDTTQLVNGALVYAHVATSNMPALKFYEHMGMRISSEIIRNLYRKCSNGCRDAYIVAGRVY